MNNSDFRNLVGGGSSSNNKNAKSSSPQKAGDNAAPTLGSRQKAFIPMTPRSIGGSGSVDFAKQLAAHRASQNPQKEKKFKSSAPLGSRFAEGYVDRAKARTESSLTDDQEERLRALEELVKEGKVDKEMLVEQSRAFGGDVSGTHLVKGLDFELLRRVKKGEDVFSGKKREDGAGDEEEEVEEDLDDVLDKALEKEIVPVVHEKKKVVEEPQKKLTRAEILANLKKSRQEAAAKAQPVLGSKFKKIGDNKKKSSAPIPPPPPPQQQSRDTSHPKKKRKLEATAAAAPNGKDEKNKKQGATEVPTERKATTVMGMLPEELPQGALAAASTNQSKGAAEDNDDDDDDIFAGAGVDYDPLAGLHDDDSSDSDDSESEGEVKPKKPPPPPPDESMQSPPPPPDDDETTMAPPPPPPTSQPPSTLQPQPQRRNYFGTPSSNESTSVSDAPLSATRMSTSELLASNPELAAAIKKASTLDPLNDPNSEEAQRAARHKAMLESMSRDDEDIDMGFGESRTFADDDEEDGGGSKGGVKAGRKRGKKKKKEE